MFPDHLTPPCHTVIMLSQLGNWSILPFGENKRRKRQIQRRTRQIRSSRGQKDAQIILSHCEHLQTQGAGEGARVLMRALGLGQGELNSWIERVRTSGINPGEREALQAAVFSL